MRIKNLKANNIYDLNTEIKSDLTLGIGGLSGSGKSTFCKTLADELTRRIVTLLPKSEYRFLFSDILSLNPSASNIQDMPLIFYLRKNGFASNPRSTIGTHSGIFGHIRRLFADIFSKSSEFFSFNNSLMWCKKCKGRGSTAGVICSECDGKRYDHGIEDYKILNNLSIIDINSMSIEKLILYAENLKLEQREQKILNNLKALGLSYLSLDRIISTLSGGEYIRLILAEFMASCSGALLILDEISTGLDRVSLHKVLNEINKLGNNNQIWFIDHSDLVLFSAEEQLYFGPGSGDNGGRIVLKSPMPEPVYLPVKYDFNLKFYEFKELYKRNIAIANLKIPANKIVSFTGESGCGKSTLLHDCIVPYISKFYRKIKIIEISQNRNQSITSKSNISTFLDIKKYIAKYKFIINEDDNIFKIFEHVKHDKNIAPALKTLLDLGLGYLSLTRKIQTLSAGEFQCVYLTAELIKQDYDEAVLILDEPSKGLSQNILNLLMQKLRYIVDNFNVSILIIEHNDYILSCSDYIFDFGRRSASQVTELEMLDHAQWLKLKEENELKIKFNKIHSALPNIKPGIIYINENADEIFDEYERAFKGGLLKNYSQTAQWILKDFKSSDIRPVIALDFESNLYSLNTYLFEIGSLINILAQKVNNNKFNINYTCECCKDSGVIDTFNFENLIINKNTGFWDGMLPEQVMAELKRANFTKLKLIFKLIKKETGFDLAKPYIKMSDEEREIFLYGLWDRTFYDADKKTQRQWRGVIHLITKYMRGVKGKFSDLIKDSTAKITCLVCKGTLIKNYKDFSIDGKSFEQIISQPVSNNIEIFKNIEIIKDMQDILGCDFALNLDISKLDKYKQAHLKFLELAYSDLSGFNLVLKNSAPFHDQVKIKEFIKNIALKNKIIFIDWDDIKLTSSEILNKIKLKPDTYSYEILGYSKISSKLNLIRNKNPCPFCGGSGVLRDESIFDGVDITRTPCSACGQFGIDSNGLAEQIENISVKTWLYGSFKDADKNLADSSIGDIKLFTKLKDLNKRDLNALYIYLKNIKKE
ncbi:MAG: ATP-binding cassette domain-containing protein [Synergistaceae bacterium]|nr:ATP-binding cassette domain-containing protein [Synergistaceae bacterium]